MKFFDPSPEAGIYVNSGAPEICETVEGVLILQKFDATSISVDSNVDITKIEGDLIALNSAQLELKVIESMNGLNNSLGLIKEKGVVDKEEDPLILENVPKNGHVNFKAVVQVNLTNDTVEESQVDRADMEKSVPDTGADGGLLHSSPSRVEPEKTNGDLHVASASPASMDDVSASEVQSTPLSLDSHTAQVCQDATKILELKMVEVIMQSTDFEITESCNDGTMIPLSDDPLIVREHEDGNKGKDTMIGLSDKDKFADLFKPVVQLSEHLEGTNGFIPGTLDSEGLSNSQVSNDLHFQYERHASQQILHSQDLLSAHVDPNKDLDFTDISGSDRGVDSMDMRYLEVLTPSVATSAQLQTSGLKVGVLLLTLFLFSLGFRL